MAKGVLRNHRPTFCSLEEEIKQIPEEELLAPEHANGKGASVSPALQSLLSQGVPSVT